MEGLPTIMALPFSEAKDRCEPELCINEKYGEAIKEAGGLLVVPIGFNGDAKSGEIMSGLLLCGGNDINPKLYGEINNGQTIGVDDKRDNAEIRLLEIALKKKIPILGICRGMQLINIFFGGSLYQDVKKGLGTNIKHDNSHDYPRNYLAHNVYIKQDSKLSGIIGSDKIMVNGFHHQGIKTIGRGLRAVAWADDGLVEAVEVPGHPFLVGVQWHPEELIDNTKWLGLFKTFVEMASVKRFIRA